MRVMTLGGHEVEKQRDVDGKIMGDAEIKKNRDISSMMVFLRNFPHSFFPRSSPRPLSR